MSKYWITPTGKYIIGYGADIPPQNATEVPTSPPDVTDIWDGTQWIHDIVVRKARYIAAIDTHIATIYQKFQRFLVEYEGREEAARAFKAGGYLGTPDAWITDFTSTVGMTPTQGADRIIAQADGMRAAAKTLGALRMQKNLVLAAATAADAQSIHDAVIAQASSIAASLG